MLIVAVVLIVLALVYYLVSTIVALRQITAGLDEAIAGVGEIIEKSAPVAEVVQDINGNLDAGVDLLEGLLVKKAGLEDVDGPGRRSVPGAAAAGLRNFPDSRTIAPRGYPRCTRRGRSRWRALGERHRSPPPAPNGPVLRNVEGGSLDARSLYPEIRQTRPEKLPRSPVIGTDSPEQYEPSDDGARGGCRVTMGGSADSCAL